MSDPLEKFRQDQTQGDPLAKFKFVTELNNNQTTDPLAKFKFATELNSNKDWRNYVYGDKEGPLKRAQFDKEVKDSIDKYQASQQKKNVSTINPNSYQDALSKSIGIQAPGVKELDKTYAPKHVTPLSTVSNKGGTITFGNNFDRNSSIAGSATAGLLDSLTLGLGSKLMDKLQPGITAQAQQEHPNIFTAGKMAGYLAPASGAAKLAKPLTSKIANPLLNKLVEGALVAGGMTGVEDTVNGKSFKDTAKDIGINTALGAGLDSGLHGLSKGISKILNKGDLPKINLASEKYPFYNFNEGTGVKYSEGNSPLTKLPIPSVEPLNTQSNVNIPLNKIEPKLKPLNNANGEAATTNLIPPFLKQRSFPQTVSQGNITSPELKRLIEKTDINYSPITNKDTLSFAEKAIKNNYDEALNLVKSNSPATAESNAIAQVLIKQLQDKGQYTEALNIIQNVSDKATKQGQAIQSLSMWGRLTPEGMLKFTQQTIDKANSALPEGKKIKLTEDLAKNITEKMKEIQTMPEGRQKTVATAEVLKKVSDQVPSSLLSKISSFQTAAQLLNGKTAIRNILGNAGFNLVENLKDVIATPLDIGLSKITGQRTMTLPSLKVQGKGFVNGLKIGYEDAVKGIDTNGIKTQFDLKPGSAFKSKIGENITKLLNVELKAPDRAFYQATYDDSIRKQMKLAKVLQPNDRMIENAHLDALYKTFQDDNAVSKAFSNVKKALNLYQDFGLGDIVLKYPKTPANILMRAVDYSPAGYAKTVIQLAKDINNKGFNQKALVEGIGRATTGTASLVGTGYILNQLGIITGQSESDYDTKEVQKTIGLGDYKLNASALKRYVLSGFNKEEAKAKPGDNIMDYSFMQPMAIGLVMGADISQNKGNPNGAISKLVDSIMTGTDTLVEQPLMQGIKRLNGQSSTSKAVLETLKGVPASFVPSILSQVRQLTDNVNRNTYDPSLLKQSLNLVKNKIPGLSNTLQPRIDVLGQQKEVFQNKSNNPANVFLNPAITTKYQDKPALQLPLNIFNQTGEKIQMPRLVDNKITDKGKTYQLTPKDLVNYQKYVGEETDRKFKALSNGPIGNPENTAKQLQKILTDINSKAKLKVLKDMRNNGTIK